MENKLQAFSAFAMAYSTVILSSAAASNKQRNLNVVKALCFRPLIVIGYIPAQSESWLSRVDVA
jgi:hypothetical protein